MGETIGASWEIIRAALVLGGLFAVVLAIVVYERLGRARARARLTAIAQRLGLHETPIDIPKPPFALDAHLTGTLEGREVALTYVARTRYSPPMTRMTLRHRPGPRYVFGPRGMLPWLTVARSGHWALSMGACPPAPIGDASFDAAFQTIAIVGYGNLTGARYASRGPALSFALKEALLASPSDTHFTSDGTSVTALRKDHLEDERAWREMFALLKVAADHPIDVDGAMAAEPEGAFGRGKVGGMGVVAIALMAGLVLAAGGVAFWVATHP